MHLTSFELAALALNSKRGCLLAHLVRGVYKTVRFHLIIFTSDGDRITSKNRIHWQSVSGPNNFLMVFLSSHVNNNSWFAYAL